jgi:hypothetical protein
MQAFRLLPMTSDEVLIICFYIKWFFNPAYPDTQPAVERKISLFVKGCLDKGINSGYMTQVLPAA